MTMPFASSEIRWFSESSSLLWDTYQSFAPQGTGIKETDRTDYYLDANLINTGIKIREGRHEFKVKAGEDERYSYGVIEHWVKWSTEAEQNILNTVDAKHLSDWIAVEKIRYKKSYAIIGQSTIEYIQEEFIDNGCGVEYTEIYIPSAQKKIFTLGFEAFSTTDQARANLLTCLRELIHDYAELKDLDSFGYPALLCKLRS